MILPHEIIDLTVFIYKVLLISACNGSKYPDIVTIKFLFIVLYKVSLCDPFDFPLPDRVLRDPLDFDSLDRESDRETRGDIDLELEDFDNLNQCFKPLHPYFAAMAIKSFS